MDVIWREHCPNHYRGYKNTVRQAARNRRRSNGRERDRGEETETDSADVGCEKISSNPVILKLVMNIELIG